MILASSFRPQKLVANRHLQTLWGTLFQRRISLPRSEQTEILLEDGDFIELENFGDSNHPRVLLLHGLEGSIRSHYIQSLISCLLSHHYYVSVMHFRGCGRRDNRLARSYHSGVSDDLQQVVLNLTRSAGAVQHIVGFSLGGNVLLKWLGEQGKAAGIASAVAVSVPLRLDICAKAINQGFSKVYQRHLIQLLKAKTLRKQRQFPEQISISPSQIKKLKTFSQFDDAVTAPLHGFVDGQDYYRKVSARYFLKSIETKTLILQARDDPFMNDEVLPDASELSEQVLLEISEKGGHVGFIKDWRGRCYLPQRILQFLQESNRPNY